APFMAGACTLNAIANQSGQIIFQTPLPGKRGTFGQNSLYSLGTWTADMTVQKSVAVSEGKSVTIRLDATNVFNHPTPSGAGLFAPTLGVSDLNLQSTVPFGNFGNKAGNRQFQLKARLDF